jgi:hypothetical protein
MNKHSATLPDGNIATRNSKTRVYTHAVAFKRVYDGVETSQWFVNSFAGNLALAEKAKAHLLGNINHPLNEGRYSGTLVSIVKVEVVA